MLKVENIDWWFLIEKKLMFGASVPHEDYINLAKELWEDVREGTLPYTMVDYPGEYDIQGVSIHVSQNKDHKLSYMITLDWERIGLIQSYQILDLDKFENADVWLYTDEKVSAKLDQMEMEWEKQELGVDVKTEVKPEAEIEIEWGTK